MSKDKCPNMDEFDIVDGPLNNRAVNAVVHVMVNRFVNMFFLEIADNVYNRHKAILVYYCIDSLFYKLAL